MTKVKLNKEEVLADLNRQLKFMNRSFTEFDNGDIDEAIRIAQIIRVLVHDTKVSTSILNHLKLKSGFKFLDTSTHYPKNELAPKVGLLSISFAGPKVRFTPHLAGAIEKNHRPYIEFFDWWSKQVVLSCGGQELTRKDIVLFTSNKAGGAHLDIDMPKHLYDLLNHKGIGLITNDEEELKNGLHCSVRQIGFELEHSIRRMI
ncbi:hypothetical protein CBQ28_09255 [Pseudoalteromonas sp. GCY]|uniref:hypothetical protein n=1 Tax=Pseudoalteromonas sp. GCY TaxID=2003316 RepID=UPI000BFED643|nr:hypothetical protein [Pseudoalteromonas sp. GCY]PHI37541.1 hypothetical protein CBQ28_09255 [Pseudoalteromonas sp. GCY]QQQ64752.1 hypothetical protein JJQ94_03835 [Pseudoalteromonas sp. GCY]